MVDRGRMNKLDTAAGRATSRGKRNRNACTNFTRKKYPRAS